MWNSFKNCFKKDDKLSTSKWYWQWGSENRDIMMIYKRCKQGQCQGHWYHRWTHSTRIQMAPPDNWVGSSPPRPGYTVWGRTTPAASLIGSSFCCRGFSSAPLSTQRNEQTKSNNNYFLLIEKNTSKGLILLFHSSEVFGNFSASELKYSCTQAVVLSWTFSCLSTSETPFFLSA